MNAVKNGQLLLTLEELEVEAIVKIELPKLSALWHDIDPFILKYFGDLFPIGPMESKEVVTLIVASDSEDRPRKPCEIYEAIKAENMRKGTIWDLIWLLARMRSHSPHLLYRYIGSVALGSPVSDSFSRRFPCLNGTMSEPSLRLVSEEAIGDPARNFKFLSKPFDAPDLQMMKVQDMD